MEERREEGWKESEEKKVCYEMSFSWSERI